MKTTIPLILLLSLAVAPATAATPIDESRPLAADGRVAIDNLKGRILVRTWDRNEVRVSGSLGEGVERLAIDGGAGSLSIRVIYPQSRGGLFNWWGGSDRGGPSNIEVRVPVRAEVVAQGVSADIDIEGVRGRRLEAKTVSGKIRAEGAPEEAEFNAVSGSLDLQLEGSSVTAGTVSGTVTLQGSPGGRITVETVSGSIAVSAGEVRRLDASTVSGSLRLKVDRLARDARIGAETLSGGIDLILPRDSSARLSVSTFSGDIRSEVGEVKRPRHGPGSSLEARLGDGDGDVRLESFSGTVRVRLE
ncbi:DUF4097 family beta strand repeat-containing protein [Rehaibacterium terrae]|jgi:DUF4097 and DUF4098 domain-containing protein YvlB|uniref:DUF4097 and DUF4098 domain-containing protein YvlB n=1 Tax=Rehaibacterium terrae TaxID=1341696 RepID=A0A7W7XZ19_9GAMM|nr:DUF4097 family beta strand repeat-containing protein [Rehaibacterium terrae]MBB5015099.1 DUF4097 and DUF4098 domain-containing protein YvlB [Rehaibacterium terrae]